MPAKKKAKRDACYKKVTGKARSNG